MNLIQANVALNRFLCRHWRSSILVCALALSSGVAAQDEPRIVLTKPDETTQEICLESGPGILTVSDGQAFLAADALRNDLDCPAAPGPVPVINSFSFSPDPLDLTTDNCDTDGDMTDDATCLFVSWDVTPAVDPTECTVDQTAPGKSSMTPFEFDNPGPNDVVDSSTFVSVADDLQWQVNQQSATVGDKTFRMQCTPTDGSGSPISASRTVNFTDGSSPTVVIDSFDIQQDMAQQGDTLNFSFNTTLQNNPSAPTCTLSSDTAGVINDVGPITATGQGQSDTATVLSDAPTGLQDFTLSCRPDSMTAATDSASDTVDIQAGSGIDCSNHPPPTGTSRDTDSTEWNELFQFWPGGSGAAEELSIGTGQYMALAFTALAPADQAGDGRASGGYSWTKGTGGQTQAIALVSYSQCPGDFSPDIDNDGTEEPECVESGLSAEPGVLWEFEGVGFGNCVLQPGTDYFLNIIFGEASDPSTTTCGDSQCGHRGIVN